SFASGVARASGQNALDLGIQRVLHRGFCVARRKVLISTTLHFSLQREIAIGCAKPWSFAPDQLRQRLLSVARSADGACKTQEVLHFGSPKLAARGRATANCAKLSPGVLRSWSLLPEGLLRRALRSQSSRKPMANGRQRCIWLSKNDCIQGVLEDHTSLEPY